MEQILELLEKGQAGRVTAIGVGGVFLALLCVYVFISVMHRSIHFLRLRQRGKSAALEAQPAALGMSAKLPRSESQSAEKTMPKETNDEDLELAASIAVALALEEKKKTRRPDMAEVKITANSWAIAGRLELMRPLKRDD
jgi:hypothetical protein